MNKIAVIDYGMGNLHSVAKAVEYVGRELGEDIDVVVTADAAKIAAADRVIFPGVGAIRDCMAEINRLNVGQIVADAMKSKPVLAICVGMQALMNRSEENGGVDCLDFMPGDVRYFGSDLRDESGGRLKVPHMGWNQVKQTRPHPLWRDVPDNSRFYFVHSYYADPDDKSVVACTTDYGVDFCSGAVWENVVSVHFHPLKSVAFFLKIYKNFIYDINS